MEMPDLERNAYACMNRITKNTTNAIAYSRRSMAKVTLPHSVGFIVREHQAMAVHVHRELANLVFAAPLPPRGSTSFETGFGGIPFGSTSRS